MKCFKEKYSQGWRALVKIDRYPYQLSHLGPEIEIKGGSHVFRKDFVVENEEK